MARILILTHEYDNFGGTRYLIKGLIDPWLKAGHQVVSARGIPAEIEFDIVVVHVDVSVVPEEYRRFAAQFPAGVNRDAVDIRKRAVSRHLLQHSDDWRGQVIVKSDLNFRGVRELHHNGVARHLDRPPPYPSVTSPATYRIYPSMDEVPQPIWADAGCVVERFLPEHDERGYWLRCWVFFGDAERCNRFCCPDPIVKGTNLIAKEPAPVPNELRAERERLGFDYGKFDFVVHDGQVVLLDANRTPTAAAAISEYQDEGAPQLASGIESMLRRRHG